tara:strand:+ start:2757 stop:4316 length:1560 start_codon:yes stop_codon:yes gene_type:complete
MRIAIYLLFLTLSATVAFADTQQEKKNIIFILADDMAYRDLSCLGQEHFATPNIDRLANEGRIFTNAYTGGPWCAPSRTSLLLGRNGMNFLPTRDEEGNVSFRPTVANILKKGGYSSCVLGKWHMSEGQDSWALKVKDHEDLCRKTNWSQMPWNRGFDVSRIGYRAGFDSRHGNPYFPQIIETGDYEHITIPENQHIDGKHIWKPNNYNEKAQFIDKNGHDATKLMYSETFYRKEAVKFMQERSESPFFLFYASPLVHSPIQTPDYSKFKDKESWPLVHKVYASMVEELDQSVGVLLDEVHALGLSKSTLIIFASDNGYSGYTVIKSMLPKDRRYEERRHNDDPIFQNKGEWCQSKFSTMNGGVIVPFIAWCPETVPAGTKTNRAINFCDFMATAAEIAGVELGPGETDGVSFLPLLEGRDASQKVRPSMIWPRSTSSFYNGLSVRDYNKNASPDERVIPNAALLDERWYAIDVNKSIYIFDTFKDPGMRNDISMERTDLLSKAKEAFASLPASEREYP